MSDTPNPSDDSVFEPTPNCSECKDSLECSYCMGSGSGVIEAYMRSQGDDENTIGRWS